MPIETLRTEISELQTQITNWENEIEIISHSIDCAMNDIEAKEAEIARLEAEAQRSDLITQLTEALVSMSNDDLANLISSLNNGEAIRVGPTVAEEHPSVLPASPRFVTVDTRHGEIAIEVPEDRPSTWMTSDEFDARDDTPAIMRDSDITIAGIRHQDLLTLHHYVPQIGERVRLEKETETSNCYGVLIASEINGLEEDMAIGILPASGRGKERELIENDLPCVCHQDMWNNTDLNEVYEITGVVIGRYVTIRKIEFVAPATEEEVEETSSSPSPSDEIKELSGLAATEEEARELFNNQMNDACQIINVERFTNKWIFEFDNHRCNQMENMRQFASIDYHE